MGSKFTISGARINKLYDKLDGTLEEFLEKNTKTTNEEVHVALWRIYQVRELQPIISLVTQWQGETSSKGKADYIK